jgi:hypothetical protein
MLKKLILAAVLFVGIAGLLVVPVQTAGAVRVDQTCKDLNGFNTNLESDTSGVWGSIEFEQDNGPLILNVNNGYEVTLCVKKGSVQNGNGPKVLSPFEGPLQDVEVNYPGANNPADGFSHYAYTFKLKKPPVHINKFAKLKIDKEWVVASDPDGFFDENNVTTEFEVEIWRNWQLVKTLTVAEDQWFWLKKGSIVKITEVVTGFNDLQCDYTADNLVKWVGWNKFFNKHTVTNTVTCEPGGRGGEPTPEPEEPKKEVEKEKEVEQVEAPVGAVEAGAGTAATSLLGALMSAGTVGAGVIRRKSASLFN